MQNDISSVAESGTVGGSLSQCEHIHWNVKGQLDKYWAGADDVRSGTVEPYETIHTTGNVLLRGGADLLWLGLRTGLTATTGAKNTLFSNAEAVIFVGNSTAAAVNTQVDLQATSSRRFAKGMEATYPIHTTGDGSTANLNIAFKSVYSTAQANFAWQEWGVGNSTKSTAPYAGRLLNRKVQSLGTKSTAATWTFTCTLSLA